MKQKDLKNLMTKTIPEIDTLVEGLEAQLVSAKMDLAKRKIKNTNLAKNIKKTIAQAKTFQRAKELEA